MQHNTGTAFSTYSADADDHTQNIFKRLYLLFETFKLITFYTGIALTVTSPLHLDNCEIIDLYQ